MDIPKTWIYVENINTGSEIIDYLTGQIKKCFLSLSNDVAPGVIGTLDERIVRPFNAVMSTEYRCMAMKAFREGTIHIMVCTDAAGMVNYDSLIITVDYTD